MERVCPKGGLHAVTGRGPSPASAHWGAPQLGIECRSAGCLPLLAFVCSLQVSERGASGEAKLKFLFEKLTTSQLKDSYL